MRAVDLDLAESFVQKGKRTKGNSAIRIKEGIVYFLHYGNIIALNDGESLIFDIPIKRQTKTVMNRLNAILREMKLDIEIRTYRTIWFFINKKTGERKEVFPGINYIIGPE